MHGDICPANVLYADGRWALTDMDAAAAVHMERMSSGYSTAYAPPEAAATFPLLAELLWGAVHLGEAYCASARARLQRQAIDDAIAAAVGGGEGEGGQAAAGAPGGEAPAAPPPPPPLPLPLPFLPWPHTLISMALGLLVASSGIRRCLPPPPPTDAPPPEPDPGAPAPTEPSPAPAPAAPPPPPPPLLSLLCDVVRAALDRATLVAHQSYDAWSLGCVLYQVTPLPPSSPARPLPSHPVYGVSTWCYGPYIAAPPRLLSSFPSALRSSCRRPSSITHLLDITSSFHRVTTPSHHHTPPSYTSLSSPPPSIVSPPPPSIVSPPPPSSCHRTSSATPTACRSSRPPAATACHSRVSPPCRCASPAWKSLHPLASRRTNPSSPPRRCVPLNHH